MSGKGPTLFFLKVQILFLLLLLCFLFQRDGRDSGYDSCPQPSWEALEFELQISLKGAVCGEHSSGVHCLCFIFLEALG